MDIVYREGRVSATDVLARLADPPSYSAVRAMLRILENKGHLRHELDGNRYLYLPTLPMHRASRSALRNVLETFFEGSTEKAVATLLDLYRDELTDEDLERLSRLIGEARKEER
ncbi:MAG: BlaI/MecI/CopY family transcriptional regulator [Deltaproteobacteria bacterium]|nr:MAG: BlaI/MecI/CopY family transcriptional regulator [Deltaproteobacteria bacterium]